jgi:glucokinase
MSVLACDVGGTRIKLGIVEGGQLLGQNMISAASDQGLAQALPRITDGLLNLCRETGVAPEACRGIGMGFPALVDSKMGRVLDEYGKYQDAPNLDLNAWARDSLGLQLAIDNDARVALMGEWAHGAGRGSDNLAMITLGTGIGTAVISEGRMLRGPHFQAGNLCSHLTVEVDGQPWFCGGRGCVEAETGSAHLDQRARSMPGFADSALAHLETIDYAAVFRHAAAGDGVTSALIQRATKLWGVLCVDMIHAFDLERFVIGGGLMASADMILPPIQKHVDRYANTPWGHVEIVAAQYPDHMALLGCEPLVDELLG